MSMDIVPDRRFRLRCAVCLVAGFACLLAVGMSATAAKRSSNATARTTGPDLSRVRPTPFSTGPLAATAPPGWAAEGVPKAERQTRYDLVVDDSSRDRGTIVLRARADASASTLRHGLFADPARTPMLRWRWRTERVLQGTDMTRKDRDDYSARLYVFFDRDPETMTLKERTQLKIDRARFGKKMPAAALCYVWDNRHPVGTIMDNVHSPFVAMVTASSGDAHGGEWQRLQRDVAEDYRRAFNADPPGIIGVAVSVDTDDTGESTTTWFGDIAFVARSVP